MRTREVRWPAGLALCGLTIAVLTSAGDGGAGAAVGSLAGTRAHPGTDIVQHQGRFIGANRSEITFDVLIEDGEYSRIKRARFRRVPTSCRGDGPQLVHGRFLGLRTHGPRFKYRGGFGSEFFRDSEILFFGELLRNGAKAKGKLRWRFIDHTGDQCSTGLLRWKTHD